MASDGFARVRGAGRIEPAVQADSRTEIALIGSDGEVEQQRRVHVRAASPRGERQIGTVRMGGALSRGARGGTPRKMRALAALRGARGGTPRKMRARNSLAVPASVRARRPGLKARRWRQGAPVPKPGALRQCSEESRRVARGHLGIPYCHAHHDVHRRQCLGQPERLADDALGAVAIHRTFQHALADDHAQARRSQVVRARRQAQRAAANPHIGRPEYGVEVPFGTEDLGSLLARGSPSRSPAEGSLLSRGAPSRSPAEGSSELHVGCPVRPARQARQERGDQIALPDVSASRPVKQNRFSAERRPLYRKASATLGAAGAQYLAAILGRHASAKPVGPLPLDDAWLVGPFHYCSPGMLPIPAAFPGTARRAIHAAGTSGSSAAMEGGRL